MSARGAGPVPAVDAELAATLRRVKLGQVLDTLGDRLALAKANKLSHAEFLQLVLADEVTRRDTTSAARRAQSAGLDPSMTLERWDSTAQVRFDRHVLDELCSLRFVEAAHNAIVMGPVGVGKTFLVTALGHIAVRRRRSVHFERADRLFKRLRIARLDNSLDAELRKLLRVDVLIIDDFALCALDHAATSDFYETVVERHQRASTIISSNRDPSEWLALMTDPLLAQSAVDRLKSAAYELVVEGESYRDRQKPKITTTD
jgi:DNA replication protein DnaC